MKLFVAAFACLLALAGCNRTDVDGGRLDLRLYPVPADSTERLRAALERVLATEDKSRLARVSSPSQGRLLVLAPVDMQGSIGAVIEALSAPTKDAGKLPAQIRLRLWTVDATPGAAADDPALQPLRPALDEARSALGAVQFALRDTTAVVSGIGQRVERSWPTRDDLDARTASTSQLVYSTTPAPDGVVLEINVGQQIAVGPAAPGGYLHVGTETTTPLRLGQTLVLSQSPLPAASGDKAAPVTRLYIVRVDPVSS